MNIQKMWDTIKRQSLQIIGIDEGEESWVSGIEQIFNMIIEENIPKLKKKVCPPTHHTNTNKRLEKKLSIQYHS